MYHRQGYSSAQGQPDQNKAASSVYNIAYILQRKISLYHFTSK